jgi:soluble lytic murein transglycosylase-like protein
MDPLHDIQGRPAPPKTLEPRERERLQKAAREFEAVFVAYMFKSMRGSVQKSGLLGEGYGGDMMDSILDMELGRQLAQKSNFGIAEMLWRRITGEPFPKQVASGGPAAEGLAARGARVTRRDAASAPPPAVPSGEQRTAQSPGKPAGSEPQERPAPGKKPEGPVIPTARPDRPVRFALGQAVAERVNTYAPLIREAAEKHGVDENLIKAVMATESAGNPRARSSADAKGLMQLIDGTAQSMGVRNSWNPRENILGGAKYLQQMLARFGGNVEHALASYNAGPGAVKRYGGIPPFRETQQYVGRVMEYLKIFAQDGETDDGED